jgi:ABC-type Na+ efflux pump permease subunit
MILLFTALNLYGSYVLTGVVEKKSSRVVEVVLARVRPSDLLAGQVAGIGVLGIGQFAALAAVAAATWASSPSYGPGGASTGARFCTPAAGSASARPGTAGNRMRATHPAEATGANRVGEDASGPGTHPGGP